MYSEVKNKSTSYWYVKATLPPVLTPRLRLNHLFNILPWLFNQSDWVTALRLLVDLSLTWKCASWSGRCRSSTSGVLGPFTTNEDRQTAKNGEGSLAPLLAWVAASQKKPRRKASQRAPALRSHLSGQTERAWPGFDAAKVSCVVFVCGELASQH